MEKCRELEFMRNVELFLQLNYVFVPSICNFIVKKNIRETHAKYKLWVFGKFISRSESIAVHEDRRA